MYHVCICNKSSEVLYLVEERSLKRCTEDTHPLVSATVFVKHLFTHFQVEIISLSTEGILSLEFMTMLSLGNSFFPRVQDKNSESCCGKATLKFLDFDLC